MAPVVRKIGFFAGSFDPIHQGHILAAQRAAAEMNLDKVYFIVEPRPRYKQGVKAQEHRIEMVGRATRNMKLLGQVIINEPHCSVTATIPALQARFAGDMLHMIIGDDVAKRLAQWADVERLARATHVIVLARHHSKEEIDRVFTSIQATKSVKIAYTYIEHNVSSLSSRQIRKQLKAGTYTHGLHPQVIAYIRTINLYGSSGFGS